MIKKEEALDIILKTSKPLGIVKETLLNSFDRVLAQNVYSKDCLPPFNKSAMDGFAIKSEDTKNETVQFEIVGLIKAGDFCTNVLQNGKSYKIMTGAPLPQGADCVIEIEKVNVDGNKLFVNNLLADGLNVIKKGEEVQEGELVLKSDTLLRPVEIGMLASLGYGQVDLYKKPTIALLVTGDELVDVDSILSYGKIRNSNEYTLKAMIDKIGATAISYGLIPDKKDILKSKLEDALKKADVIITSGGASVGDYDFVSEVLEELGAKMLFDSVAIKPGKPLSFWKLKEKLIFSLPGNPLSAIITFEQFIKPAIKKIMNCYEDEEFLTLTAGDDFKVKKGRAKFISVKIKKEEGKYIAYKIGSQSSNHLKTLTKANGIMIIPEEREKIKAGDVLYGKFIFK